MDIASGLRRDSARWPRRATVPVAPKPLDVRATIVTLAAVVILLAALRAAQSLAMPVVLCLFVAWALNPWVRAFQKLGLPRTVATSLVLVMLAAGIGGGAYALSDDVLDAVNRFPAATEKIRLAIREWRHMPGGSINQLSEAASDLEAAAKDLAGSQSNTTGMTRVEVVEPPLRLRELFWGGSKSAVDFSSELVMLVFLLFFLLASGDLLKRKAVVLAGPTLSARRRLLRIVNDTNENVERFLIILAATSALLAAMTSVVFWQLGVEHPLLWGIAAGILDVVPYVGASVFLASSFAVTLLQFGTIRSAFVVAAAAVLMTTIVGQWLKPWLMARRASVNAPAVFLAMLLGGWLWGGIGMLLSFPILVVIKTIADRVDRFKVIAVLLCR